MNDMVMAQFEKDDKFDEVFPCMCEYLLPAFACVVHSSNGEEDEQTVEDIRSKWCQVVGQDDLSSTYCSTAVLGMGLLLF